MGILDKYQCKAGAEVCQIGIHNGVAHKFLLYKYMINLSKSLRVLLTAAILDNVKGVDSIVF